MSAKGSKAADGAPSANLRSRPRTRRAGFLSSAARPHPDLHITAQICIIRYICTVRYSLTYFNGANHGKTQAHSARRCISRLRRCARRPLRAGEADDNGRPLLARTVSLPFSETLHEKVVIFNRPGAGGNIGTSQVVKARPDGTTVGYVTNGIMCVNSHLYDRQAFDPLKDLEPVAGLTSIGLVLAVSPKALPDVRSAADLVKLAISRPGEIAFASAGPGTTSHLAGILFEREAGLDLNHIPHAGGAAAVKEVLSGRVPFLIDVMPNLLPHLKAGTLRALAVTTPSRSALLPEVPTMVEAGLPGVTLYAWDGIAAPKGLSDADADRFAKAARAALNDKAVRDRLLRMGAEPQFRGPADFRQFIEAEAAKWRPLALMARAQR